MSSPTSAGAIEIRVEEIAQLFNMLDPFPFRERDLDKDAEEFIVSRARELRATPLLEMRMDVLDWSESRLDSPSARTLGWVKAFLAKARSRG